MIEKSVSREFYIREQESYKKKTNNFYSVLTHSEGKTTSGMFYILITN